MATTQNLLIDISYSVQTKYNIFDSPSLHQKNAGGLSP